MSSELTLHFETRDFKLIHVLVLFPVNLSGNEGMEVVVKLPLEPELCRLLCLLMRCVNIYTVKWG